MERLRYASVLHRWPSLSRSVYLSASGESRKVVYSLVDSAEGVFSIDKWTGVVALERPLDREVQSSYLVVVRASDLGVPYRLSSLTNLTIAVLDVNDNPPVFERRDYSATLGEDAAAGTAVLRVHAHSKDIGTNADIYYSIRSGNTQGHFSIETHTGEGTNLVLA